MTTIQELSPDQIQTLENILSQAQTDRDFRSRLLARPKAVLAAAGVGLPAGLDLRALDAAPQTTYLVLPQPPIEGEVSDAELSSASGGTLLLATAAMVIAVTVTFALSESINHNDD